MIPQIGKRYLYTHLKVKRMICEISKISNESIIFNILQDLNDGTYSNRFNDEAWNESFNDFNDFNLYYTYLSGQDKINAN